MPPYPRGHNRRGSLFHALVLASGFIAGGVLQQVGRKFLPPGAAKEFFTTGVTPSLGPLPVDLVILKFAVGPVALDVGVRGLRGRPALQLNDRAPVVVLRRCRGTGRQGNGEDCQGSGCQRDGESSSHSLPPVGEVKPGACHAEHLVPGQFGRL
jgi:hypothetical protein